MFHLQLMNSRIFVLHRYLVYFYVFVCLCVVFVWHSFWSENSKIFSCTGKTFVQRIQLYVCIRQTIVLVFRKFSTELVWICTTNYYYLWELTIYTQNKRQRQKFMWVSIYWVITIIVCLLGAAFKGEKNKAHIMVNNCVNSYWQTFHLGSNKKGLFYFAFTFALCILT